MTVPLLKESTQGDAQTFSNWTQTCLLVLVFVHLVIAGTGDRTQGLVHARQALLLSYISSPFVFIVKISQTGLSYF